jgi:uncharacterized protein (TIGR00251 family)
VRLRVRLAPKASRNVLRGVENGRLKVAVTAVPEGGKANQALIRLLAKTWRLAKSDISVVAGARDRNKDILITGATQDIHDVLSRWLVQQQREETL